MGSNDIHLAFAHISMQSSMVSPHVSLEEKLLFHDGYMCRYTLKLKLIQKIDSKMVNSMKGKTRDNRTFCGKLPTHNHVIQSQICGTTFVVEKLHNVCIQWSLCKSLSI